MAKNATEDSDFDQWYLRVVEIAIHDGYYADAGEMSDKDWKGYFDNGYTPEQALNEDQCAGF